MRETMESCQRLLAGFKNQMEDRKPGLKGHVKIDLFEDPLSAASGVQVAGKTADMRQQE
jgi:hypothetical protein